jgi:hypothetical protein
MPLTPREVAEQVRKMVAGEGVVFADLFAADGVLAYPFAPPGHPRVLRGQDAIRVFFTALGQSRELFTMEGIDAVTWQTDDPEVAITQITHHGKAELGLALADIGVAQFEVEPVGGDAGAGLHVVVSVVCG